MRTEQEVCERLERMEKAMTQARKHLRRAADNPPTSDEDPQLLSATQVAIASAIQELCWVLEVTPAQDIPDPNEPGPQRS
jgi:type II secretory pathway component PulJ